MVLNGSTLLHSHKILLTGPRRDHVSYCLAPFVGEEVTVHNTSISSGGSRIFQRGVTCKGGGGDYSLSYHQNMWTGSLLLKFFLCASSKRRVTLGD